MNRRYSILLSISNEREKMPRNDELKYTCSECREGTNDLMVLLTEVKIVKHVTALVCPKCVTKILNIPFKYKSPYRKETS